MRRKCRTLSPLIAGLLLASACAPSPEGGGPSVEVAAPPAREKTITLMIQREPGSLNTPVTGHRGGARAGGVNQVGVLFGDGLTEQDETGRRVPALAAEVPTLANRLVVVNPDGSMDVTWKLRPDAYWHDGAPVTSADYIFNERVYGELQIVGTRPSVPIVAVTEVGPKTFVVRWGGPYVNYDTGVVSPLPKHILGDLLDQLVAEGKAQDFSLSRFFWEQHVSTGPYRVVAWEAGAHIEGRRFEQYYKGVPPIHRLFLRFVPDTNTMAANLLAETVDVSLPEGIDLDLAFELRDRWAGEGKRHQVIVQATNAPMSLEIMVDPQYARPVNGFTQVPVRQGLFHAINREEINEVFTRGQAPVIDSYYATTDPFRHMVEGYIPQYPYDNRRAEQLLGQGGWTRGGDGIMVHQPSGERFEAQLMLFPGQQHLKLGSMIQDMWKQVGVELQLESLTPANQADVSYTSTRKGLFQHNPGGSAFYTSRYLCRARPTPENNWSGSNRGRLCDQRVNGLLSRLNVAIDPTEQTQLHRQLLAIIMGEAIQYPLYWETVPILMLDRITGFRAMGGTSWAENIHEWDVTG